MPQLALTALTADRERAALALFEATLDHDGADRDRWLAEQCAGDAALLARVRSLIAADAAGDTAFLSAAANDTQVPGADPWMAVLPPPQIGPYRLEELIGSGGMGAVYRASRNDGLFEQTVAVKFVRPLRGRAQVDALVDAERRLLARMQHPAIARILDGGSTAQGLHYLVMEFVNGVAIDEYIRTHALSVRARVTLLREVCAAVAHAHQHLVLHCDLKPDNILVTDEGRPKLIDFGVARLQGVLDASLPQGLTREYASPQRLDGEPATVSDDVYSLGMVLCELLTGERPDLHSTAGGGVVDAELAAIVRQAIAPERDARYAGMKALDDDLQSWLECRPVAAMGKHWRYRTRKLVQRRPWRVASASVALGGLVAAVVVIATLYTRADAARRETEQRFAQVRALANYMLFELDAQLEVTPGTTQARRELVGRSQQYLDALGATAGDNAQLQREVAVGLARLAEVQGGWGMPNVGEPELARPTFERAERMLADLVERRPGEWSWRRDLARVQYRLADFYGGRDNDAPRQLHKAREAETHATRAIAGAATQGVPPKEQAELESLLSSIRLAQAFALDWTGESTAAAEIARREESRLLALPETTRREMEFEYRAGRPALQLGDSLFYLNRHEDALAAYRRALDRYAQGLAKVPTHRRLLDGSAVGRWSASAALTELGRHAEALAEIDLALPIGARLVALDPGNVSTQRLRSTLRSHRALVLGRLARYDEAVALAEDDQREREARARKSPDDAEPARDAAVPLYALAELYGKKGDAAAACAAWRRGVQAWTAIERRWGLSELDRRQNIDAAAAAAGRCPR